MTEVSLSGEGYVVEARLVAEAFGISQDMVKDEMRGGRITTRCEIGEGEDAGRTRMTFYRGEQAFRLVVNGDGTVLSRSTFPVRRRDP